MKLTIEESYQILGIKIGCTEDELKKAFRGKAMLYHPDKNAGKDELFKKVNEAKEVVDKHRKSGGGTQTMYNVNGRYYTESEILQAYFEQMKAQNERDIREFERMRKRNYIQVNAFVLRMLATMMTIGLYVLFHMIPGLIGSIMRIILLTAWITTLMHAKTYVEYLYEKQIKK